MRKRYNCKRTKTIESLKFKLKVYFTTKNQITKLKFKCFHISIHIIMILICGITVNSEMLKCIDPVKSHVHAPYDPAFFACPSHMVPNLFLYGIYNQLKKKEKLIRITLIKSKNFKYTQFISCKLLAPQDRFKMAWIVFALISSMIRKVNSMKFCAQLHSKYAKSNAFKEMILWINEKKRLVCD